MSRQDGLSQWMVSVSTRMPHLSRPQAQVLALWSYGMVVAQSCGVTTVATLLGLLLGQSPATLRQRLREWCYAAPDKRGAQRQDLDVDTCFAPLLRWVLAWWAPDERRLALALDATTLGQRFTVLAVSVVYRGCAIPVAWRVVGATEKGTWRPHWEALLCAVQPAVPADWTVLVLADAGCTHAGSIGISWGAAGTRFCASTKAASFGPRTRGASVRSAQPRPASGRAGVGRWTASPREKAGSPARCWRAGKRPTPSPGCS
jgi:hypothetical protein